MLPKRDNAAIVTTNIKEKTIVSSFTKSFFIDWVKKKYPMLANRPKDINQSALLTTKSLINEIIPFKLGKYKNYLNLLLLNNKYI